MLGRRQSFGKISFDTELQFSTKGGDCTAHSKLQYKVTSDAVSYHKAEF